MAKWVIIKVTPKGKHVKVDEADDSGKASDYKDRLSTMNPPDAKGYPYYYVEKRD